MTDSLQDLSRAFHDGTLPRDQYWSAMQERHVRLREYQLLLRETPVEAIRIGRDDLQLELANGLRLAWNEDDVRTVPNILLHHGEYEADELDALTRAARGCRVVIDVGANVGWYSLHLARGLAATGGRVYAMEPVPDTFRALTRNIELNALQDVIVPTNAGFGSEARMISFFVPAFTGSVAASQRQLFPGEANREIVCRLTTLDDFVEEHGIARVDLIKADVEGAEIDVLRGARRTLARDRPILFLEMLRKWAAAFDYHPDDIIALLREHGYRCYSMQGQTLREFEQITEEVGETNFFFLQPAHHAALSAHAP
jgi:FkbM family methyltransferase